MTLTLYALIAFLIFILKFGHLLAVFHQTNPWLKNIPFIGEFSYVYLLKKYRGISVSTGLGTLFLARFFDVLTVANLVILAVFFVSQEKLPKEIAVLALALAIIAVSTSLILIFFAGFLWKALSFLFRTRLFFSYVQDSLGNISSVFLSVREKTYFLKLFFLSFIIWFLNFGVGIMLFRALNLDFNFLETVFIFSLPMIVSEFSPVQSFANLGLYEWSLVGGLVIFGISRDMAAQSSILIHGIELIFSLLLGLAGFLILYIAKYDKHN